MAGKAMDESGSSYQTLIILIQYFNGVDYGQVEDKRHVDVVFAQLELLFLFCDVLLLLLLLVFVFLFIYLFIFGFKFEILIYLCVDLKMNCILHLVVTILI